MSESEGHGKELVRTTAVYSFGTLFTQVISFLLLPLYTRYLGPEDYGNLSLLFVYSTALGLLTEFGLVSGMMRFVPTATSLEKKQLLSCIFWFFVSVGSLVLLTVWEFASVFQQWLVPSAPIDSNWILLATGTAVLNPLARGLLKTLQIRKQAFAFVGTSFLQFLTSVTVTVYLVVWVEMGVEGVLLGQLSGQALLAIRSLVIHVPFMATRPTRSAFDRLMSFSLPLIPANLAALIIALSDRFFLERLATLEEVGIYAVADKMATVLQVLLVSTFGNAWHQFVFTRQTDPRLPATFREASRVYGVLFLTAITLFSLFVPDLLRIATTEEFVRGYRLVPLLCIAPLVQGWVLFAYDGIHLSGRTGVIPKILGSGMVANLILNAVLIPEYGMYGAAVATALSMLGIAFGAYWATVERYPVQYPIHLWGKVGTLSALTLAVFLAIDPVDPLESVGFRVVLAGLYSAAVWNVEGVGRQVVAALSTHVFSRFR